MYHLTVHTSRPDILLLDGKADCLFLTLLHELYKFRAHKYVGFKSSHVAGELLTGSHLLVFIYYYSSGHMACVGVSVCIV